LLFRSLADHIRYIHTKEGLTEKCYFCDAKIRYGGMENHLRMHTREKPNICKYCHQDFFEKYDLRQHILSKHGASQEGKKLRLVHQLRCYFCLKIHPSFSILKQHMRRHTREVLLVKQRIQAPINYYVKKQIKKQQLDDGMIELNLS